MNNSLHDDCQIKCVSRIVKVCMKGSVLNISVHIMCVCVCVSVCVRVCTCIRVFEYLCVYEVYSNTNYCINSWTSPNC